MRDGVGEFDDENLELRLEIQELLLPSFFPPGALLFTPFFESSGVCPFDRGGREGGWLRIWGWPEGTVVDAPFCELCCFPLTVGDDFCTVAGGFDALTDPFEALLSVAA